MRMRSLVFKAALSLGLILVLVIAGALFAFTTRPGSAWLVSSLARGLAPMVSVEDFQGRLLDRFSVRAFEVSVDGTQVSIADLDCSWRPSGLIKRKLVIRQLSAQQIVVTTNPTDETASTPVQLTLPRLPLTLDIQAVTVNALDVLVGNAKHQIENIKLAVKWSNDALEINKLAAALGEQQVTLTGTIQNETPLGLNARLAWSSIVNNVRSSASVKLSGPLNALTFESTTSGIVTSRAEGSANLTDPGLPFSITLNHDENQFSPHSGIRVDSGTLNASGSMKGVEFRYAMRGAGSAGEILAVEINGRANGFEAINDGIDGELDWQINHPLFHESTLNGHTVLAFRNDRLDIENSTRAPFTSQLKASLNPADLEQRITALVTWNDFRVPGLPADELIAQNGQLDFSGTAATANVSLESAWSHRAYGVARINAAGVLNEQKLMLTSGVAEILNGSIDYTGAVDWHHVPNANLDIDATRLDVSMLRADLEAVIDLAATVQVNAPESGPQTTITLKQLAGTWLGQQLNATGKLNFDPGNTLIEDLHAAIGDNRIAIDLSLSDELVGGYEINAPDLSGIDPQFRGRLSGAGRFAGTRDKPTVDGKLTGSDLKIYSWALNSLAMDYDISPFSARSSYLRGELAGLRQKGTKNLTANVSIQAEGDAANHHASLNVDTDAAQLAAELNGSWLEDRWQGVLDTLSIRDSALGDWALREKAGVIITSTGDFNLLDELCIEQTAAGLCLSSAQRDKERTKIDGALRSLPIALFNPWLPSGLKASGNLSGQFEVDGSKEGFTGAGKYAIDEGKITALLEDNTSHEIPIKTFSGQFDANTEIANLGVITQIGDWLDLQIDAKVPSASDEPIHANIEGVSENIAWLGEFLPDLAGSNGRMEINGRVSGQRDNPAIDVTAGLKSGALALPATGLRFSGFDVAVKSAGSRVLSVDLRAKPQKGELHLTGKLRTEPEKNWPFQFTFAGDAVSAARLPELEMDIAPSLAIIGNSEKIAVTGTVGIPYFSYTLNEMPKSAVRVSSDTVIVGGEDKEQQPQESAANWFEQAVFLDVDVQLGDQVNVAGLGMFATLTGGVEVTKDFGDEIKGTGTVLIANGDFDAYGHSLSIKNGRMMFAGPITNPTLNIRAVRDNIPVIAGVVITGSARAPKFDVFSDPALPDAEALSYIIIGQPLGEGTNADAALISQAALGFGLDQSAVITNQLRDLFALDEFGLNTGGDIDQTALTAGKQITPKVSVRTEMNVFDQLWSFFLRYKLTEKWSVEAESGERQGADIIYNVESESIMDFNPFK